MAKNLLSAYLKKNILSIGLVLFLVLFFVQTFRSLGQKNQEIRLLFLGDSTTKMGHGKSWPQILARLLKGRYAVDFIAINEGQGGSKVQDIEHRIHSLLHQYSPDFVFLMTGVDDPHVEFSENFDPLVFWNKAWKSSSCDEDKDPKKKEKDRPSDELYHQHKFEKFLQTYKSTKTALPPEILIKMGFAALELDRLTEAQQYFDEYISQSDKKGKAYREIVAPIFHQDRLFNPEILMEYAQLALSEKDLALDDKIFFLQIFHEIYSDHPDLRDPQRSFHYFQKLISLESMDAFHMDLEMENQLRFGQYGLAAQLAKEAIEKFSDSPEYLQVSFRQNLIWSLDMMGKQKETVEEVKVARMKYPHIQYWQRVESKEHFLQDLKARLRPWKPHGTPFANPETLYSFYAILAQISKHGAHPIFVQYPNRELSSLKKIFNLPIPITLIELKESFKDQSLWEKYFTDLFAGDTGHLTAQGNHQVAQTVFSALVEAKLFE